MTAWVAKMMTASSGSSSRLENRIALVKTTGEIRAATGQSGTQNQRDGPSQPRTRSVTGGVGSLPEGAPFGWRCIALGLRSDSWIWIVPERAYAARPLFHSAFVTRSASRG
jgi:hypothetical protein